MLLYSWIINSSRIYSCRTSNCCAICLKVSNMYYSPSHLTNIMWNRFIALYSVVRCSRKTDCPCPWSATVPQGSRLSSPYSRHQNTQFHGSLVSRHKPPLHDKFTSRPFFVVSACLSHSIFKPLITFIHNLLAPSPLVTASPQSQLRTPQKFAIQATARLIHRILIESKKLIIAPNSPDSAFSLLLATMLRVYRNAASFGALEDGRPFSGTAILTFSG